MAAWGLFLLSLHRAEAAVMDALLGHVSYSHAHRGPVTPPLPAFGEQPGGAR